MEKACGESKRYESVLSSVASGAVAESDTTRCRMWYCHYQHNFSTTDFRFCFIVALLTFIASIASAQGMSSIKNSIEESVKKKKIKWFLAHKEIKDKEASYQWHEEDKIVAIRIIETASSKEAADLLAQEQMKRNGPYTTQLKEYGDEAYLYKSKRRDTSTIIFRQGNYFVSIGADRFRDAKEFAKEICDLTKSIKSAK